MFTSNVSFSREIDWTVLSSLSCRWTDEHAQIEKARR